jgi:hypothetical protein
MVLKSLKNLTAPFPLVNECQGQIVSALNVLNVGSVLLVGSESNQHWAFSTMMPPASLRRLMGLLLTFSSFHDHDSHLHFGRGRYKWKVWDFQGISTQMEERGLEPNALS